MYGYINDYVNKIMSKSDAKLDRIQVGGQTRKTKEEEEVLYLRYSLSNLIYNLLRKVYLIKHTGTYLQPRS